MTNVFIVPLVFSVAMGKQGKNKIPLSWNPSQGAADSNSEGVAGARNHAVAFVVSTGLGFAPWCSDLQALNRELMATRLRCLPPASWRGVGTAAATGSADPQGLAEPEPEPP